MIWATWKDSVENCYLFLVSAEKQDGTAQKQKQWLRWVWRLNRCAPPWWSTQTVYPVAPSPVRTVFPAVPQPPAPQAAFVNQVTSWMVKTVYVRASVHVITGDGNSMRETPLNWTVTPGKCGFCPSALPPRVPCCQQTCGVWLFPSHTDVRHLILLPSQTGVV